MSLLTDEERQFMDAVGALSYCNPFLPERIERERDALGEAFDERAVIWSKQADLDGERPNIARLSQKSEALAKSLRDRLVGGVSAAPRDLDRYEDLVNYVLYHRFRHDLAETMEASGRPGATRGPVPVWSSFLDEYQQWLAIPGRKPFAVEDAAHLWSCFYQVRRAFQHIYENIIGQSMPSARLRASVWQSVFTHDMRRYRRSLYQRMGDFTTLITGPSGTGKELVARAIGLSRYVPFDVGRQQFADNVLGTFHPLNLSALSSALIESELFGHCRGAFTGAVSDRPGWLEVCPPRGTIFLDEIGELDVAIQVKLLRILQTRTFQRLGETTDRQFHGKIIAATNQDLSSRIGEGSFRSDFFFRLCSDVVTTPSLREQLADCPDELSNLVLYIARGIAGEEADSLAADVEAWIVNRLGRDYPWPGNIRELEQCVRNVAIRNEYLPAAWPEEPRRELASAMMAGSLTAEQLLRGYCTLVYAQSGSYGQAAERLHLDRRTIKSKVDAKLLARLCPQGSRETEPTVPGTPNRLR